MNITEETIHLLSSRHLFPRLRKLHAHYQPTGGEFPSWYFSSLDQFIITRPEVYLEGVQCIPEDLSLHPVFNKMETLNTYDGRSAQVKMIDPLMLVHFKHITFLSLHDTDWLSPQMIETMGSTMKVLKFMELINNHVIQAFKLRSDSLVELSFIHWHKMKTMDLVCPALTYLGLDNCSRIARDATHQLLSPDPISNEPRVPKLRRLMCQETSNSFMMGACRAIKGPGVEVLDIPSSLTVLSYSCVKHITIIKLHSVFLKELNLFQMDNLAYLELRAPSLLELSLCAAPMLRRLVLDCPNLTHLKLEDISGGPMTASTTYQDVEDDEGYIVSSMELDHMTDPNEEENNNPINIDVLSCMTNLGDLLVRFRAVTPAQHHQHNLNLVGLLSTVWKDCPLQHLRVSQSFADDEECMVKLHGVCKSLKYLKVDGAIKEVWC